MVPAALALALAAPVAHGATYVWNAAGGSFAVATNWTPSRLAPAATDVLVFDGAVTPSAAVTGLSTQTIAQLLVVNGVALTLSSPATATLTIAGDAGTDFDVDGSSLTTLSGNIITITIASGATGTVRNSGVVTMQGGSHKVLPADAGALHFQTGGRFVSDAGITGNPFGNSGTANAVVFESSSMFVYRAGANPFGLTQPASRVVFQAGSVFRQETGSLPSVAGRVYADYELDCGLGSVTIAVGSNTWTVDHLRCLTGTLNVNGTAAGTMSLVVRGDLNVAAGSSFNFTPSTFAGSVTFDGAGPQAVSSTNDAAAGTGNLTLGPLANVVVGATSALQVAAGDLVVQGSLSFPGRIACAGPSRVVMAPGSTFSPGPAAWVDGTLVLGVPAGSPSVLFPVGDALVRTPVQLDFASVSTAGQLAARATAGDHPTLIGSGLDAAKSVNRWWHAGPAGGVLTPPAFTTCDVTLNYDIGDLDVGATPASFIVGKFDSPAWTLPAHGPGSFAAIQATGISSFSDFAVAEPSPCPAITVTPASLAAGNAGSPYSAAFGASGGTAPYTFAVVIGSLPPGLTLAPGGALTGTPTTAGTYPFTVAATDAASCSGVRSYSMTINGPCPPISLSPPTLPGGIIGTPYGQPLSASGGTAPYTFAVTSGALPGGLALSPAGVVSGTCTALGAFGFDITATDANGCTGTQSYAVSVTCPALLVFPTVFLAGTVGAPFGATCVGSGGVAPYTFAVTSGVLPPGLTLASGGALAGVPTAAGAFPFTITTTDANGCTGSRAYTLNIIPVDLVSAGPAPSCISSATPCIAVPVSFLRSDATPMRAYSVTIQLSPELALCGPQFTSAGFVPPGSGGTAFFVTPGAPGEWIVDESTLGLPCGVTGSGTLFYVHVTSSAPVHTSGTISVTAVTVRDCSNAPIPGSAGSPAPVTIDWTGPAAIADLSAAQQLTGNDADGTTKITLSFTPPPDAAGVSVWRKAFGGYPQYDENGGTAPAAPATPMAATFAGWTLTPVTAPGQSDEPPMRDFWYYVAFSADACGNVSAVSNRTNGTLDYHLGDVVDGVTPCAGENLVTTADIAMLGANYHTSIPLNGALECLDVGPTTDNYVHARPTTDNFLDFEDLMIFSINYGQVSAPQMAGAPARHEAAASAVWVEAPGQVAAGERVRALVRVRGEGELRGLSTRLTWDASVVRPARFSAGGWLESQGGVVLAAGPGGADGALLGAGATGMAGEGTLAEFEFEALRTGAPAIALARVVARDAANRPATLAGQPASGPAGVPARTSLAAAFPNPFRGSTAMRLSLAEAGPVKLVVYDLGGRRVRTLLDEVAPAGERVVPWDGRDDAGLALPQGLFVVRLVAGGGSHSQRVLLVK